MHSRSLSAALPDRLDTDRLVLRAPGPDDIKPIARLADNFNIHAMTTLPYPYGEDHALEFVSNFARCEREHAFAICLGGEGLVGMIGLHFNGQSAPEIGYWIGEPFWGRAIATEAGHAVVDAAMGTGLCPALGAQVRAENTASRRVLEKLGFAEMHHYTASGAHHAGAPMIRYRLERPEQGR